MGFAEHSILGPRPLALRSSYVAKHTILGGLGLIAGVAVGVAYLAWQGAHVQSLLHEQEVWERGVPAAMAQVGGEITSHSFIIHDYELEIRYMTVPAGDPPTAGVHDVEFEFMTLFGGPGAEPPEAVIRHLPDDATKFALSWAVDSAPSRWAAIGFMSLAGLLIAVGIVALGGAGLKSLRTAKAAAFRSDDVLLEIVNIEELEQSGKPTGALKYTYVPRPAASATSAGIIPKTGVTQAEITFGKAKYPLFAGSDGDPDAGPVVGAFMLGLRPAFRPDEMLIPRDDLHPLDIPPARLPEVRSRLAEQAAALAPAVTPPQQPDEVG